MVDVRVALSEENDRLTDTVSKQAIELEKLRNDVRLAVMSDSEMCKVLERENERLLKSRNRWAKKYNDLLAKRRAEDGYDVYAEAREEYRKKIAEQAQEIEKLRAALREIAKVTRGWEPGVWSEEEGRKYFSGLFFSAQHVARAALGGSDG